MIFFFWVRMRNLRFYININTYIFGIKILYHYKIITTKYIISNILFLYNFSNFLIIVIFFIFQVSTQKPLIAHGMSVSKSIIPKY